MKVICRVTRYAVRNNQIQESTQNEETSVMVMTSTNDGQDWIMLGNCEGSMPLAKVQEAIDRGGWYAQSGTKPVYSPPCPHPESAHECCGRTCELPNGGWGGRNYPRIFVPAESLKTMLHTFDAIGVTR